MPAELVKVVGVKLHVFRVALDFLGQVCVLTDDISIHFFIDGRREGKDAKVVAFERQEVIELLARLELLDFGFLESGHQCLVRDRQSPVWLLLLKPIVLVHTRALLEYVLGPHSNGICLEWALVDQRHFRIRVSGIDDRQVLFCDSHVADKTRCVREFRRRNAHSPVQSGCNGLKCFLNQVFALLADLGVSRVKIGKADDDLLTDHFQKTAGLGVQLRHRHQALFVDEVQQETDVLHVEDVHGEALLVEALDHDRAQLHIVVEPGVASARLVQPDELVVRDEADTHADPLSLQASRFSDDFHLGVVLVLVEHEDEDARLVLELVVLEAKLDGFLFEEARLLFELSALVQKALNVLLSVQLHERVLQTVDEVQDARSVVQILELVERKAEIGAFVHDKESWNVVNRDAFLFEEVELLADVCTANLNFLALLTRVYLVVEFLLQLRQDGLCVAALEAR